MATITASRNLSMFNFWTPNSVETKQTADTHENVHEDKAAFTSKDAVASTVTSIFGRTISRSLHILSICWIVLPRRGQPANPKAPHQLHPMAYLDALRGYLALIIYTRHFMPRDWRWIPNWIIATPGLQFPFRGAAAALNIFFFISGYVITFKSVGLIQTRQYDKLMDVLASAVFRRYLRLFLPVLGTTLFTIVLFKVGIAQPPLMRAQDMAGNAFIFWIRDSINAIDPTKHVAGWRIDRQVPGSQLLNHFWSIRTEFRSSMMLYMFCAGTCKLSIVNRKRLIWLCILLLTYWQANWAAMALLGMWFGERRRERARGQAGSVLPSRTDAVQPVGQDIAEVKDATDFDRGGHFEFVRGRMSRHLQSFKHFCGSLQTIANQIEVPARVRDSALIAIFLYSFVVMHDPYGNQTNDLFAPRVLRAITPHHWDPSMKMFFQMMVGSFLMLYPLDLMPILQKPLLTPFSQFLGELSFGIYAMQYTVGWSVFPRYLTFAQQRYGRREFDLFWHIFPGYLIMTIVLLWASELFRRCDVQVVKLCARLEKHFSETI